MLNISKVVIVLIRTWVTSIHWRRQVRIGKRNRNTFQSIILAMEFGLIFATTDTSNKSASCKTIKPFYFEPKKPVFILLQFLVQKPEFFFIATDSILFSFSLSKVISSQCDQIWRNFATLAKFCKSLGNFEKLKLVFGNFVNLLGQIDKLLGKFPLLWMAQYWKIIYPSGHTDGKPLTLMRTWK